MQLIESKRSSNDKNRKKSFWLTHTSNGFSRLTDNIVFNYTVMAADNSKPPTIDISLFQEKQTRITDDFTRLF